MKAKKDTFRLGDENKSCTPRGMIFPAKIQLNRYINNVSHEINWHWSENSIEEALKGEETEKSHKSGASAFYHHYIEVSTF